MPAPAVFAALQGCATPRPAAHGCAPETQVAVRTAIGNNVHRIDPVVSNGEYESGLKLQHAPHGTMQSHESPI
jgi:hypothetical protein